ncbi:hypothetical protein IW262DRAFT_1297629 [Armillaria fumosa]|nr:hypothetical protein IW262DRAFT_1297629 [Armillaria fumosa]
MNRISFTCPAHLYPTQNKSGHQSLKLEGLNDVSMNPILDIEFGVGIQLGKQVKKSHIHAKGLASEAFGEDFSLPQIPLSKRSKSTAIVVFMSVVLQSVGAGTTQCKVVYAFLFYVLFIHPHVLSFMVLGQLQAVIDETTVFFKEHNTLLVTEEKMLRELRATTYVLTTVHLGAYRRVSITDVCSWMVYASKVKDTWKQSCEYRKGITDLKTKIEVKSLEDVEVYEQTTTRAIVVTDGMV